MITQQITCDICGKHKQDTNHWWMATAGQNFSVTPWDKEQEKYPRMHYCGQACVIAAVSKWMEAKSK